MADYTRLPHAFAYRGISLLPADRLAPGQVPYIKNMRSYEEGTLQPRYGLTQVTDAVLGGGALVHTIVRLNDSTPFASVAARRLIGAGTVLYSADASINTYTSLDTGYSGDPLSIVTFPPVRSPQPWAYITDRSRMRKTRVNGEVYPIGSAQPVLPTTAPAVTLTAPNVTVISDFNTAADWTQVGSIAAAPSDQTRVSTTISAIVYDAGTTGYASIAPASMANITTGTRLDIAGAETVLVTDILVAVASTTVAAIIYDSGSTGLCTIQPAASLGTGQLESPVLQDYQRRLQQTGVAGGPRVAVPRGQPTLPSAPSADPARLTRIRQVDFPVNSLVTLAGSETVRILSVSVGPDGVQSFRCSTTGTIAATNSITGIAGFRAFTVSNRVATDTVTAAVVQEVITPTTTATVVAGLQDTTSVNLALINSKATTDEDYLHLAVKVSLLSAVQEIRLYLNVDTAAPNYLDNYFMGAWRANDLIRAVQSTNAAVVDTLQDARQGAILNDQINQPVDGRTAQPRDTTGERTAVPRDGGAIPGTGYTPSPNAVPTGRVAVPRVPSGDATALNARSPQLALGNNQWIDLTLRIRDLNRIGTDHTRTLAHVNGVQVLITLAGFASAITFQFDSAWISGAAGPDAGAVGVPYNYTYRGRSSLTGVVTNPAPPSRGGVMPRRQRVTLTGTQFADTQIDLVDWFRIGGALTGWRYVGTSANSATPAFTDDTTDGALDSGEPLAFDRFQPWPTHDLARTGTCNVAGTAISRVSGASFDLAWAPGTIIIVNGITTTIYAIASTSLLHVTTNCGSGTGVTFDLPEPLKLGQPLPAAWGGVVQNVQFLFACGDPTDPGSLHWSFGNDPDTTSDANWLSVTSASEPLQHGCVSEYGAFVFSTEQLYLIDAAFGSPSVFVAKKTPCGRGLWARWGFCQRAEGIYFIGKDGIYLTPWGAPAISITDPDLRELFPHDGVAGRSVNSFSPPDMTNAEGLRLADVDGMVYFDYDSVGSGRKTLIYDPVGKRWFSDEYARMTIACRASEPGTEVHQHLLGGTAGQVYLYTASAIADVTTSIAWVVWTQWIDGGDPRSEKQFGDVVLDVNPGDTLSGISTVGVYNNAASTLPAETIGVGESTRRPYILDIAGGDGVLARNFGLRIEGTVTSLDTGRPKLYTWEPSFLPKGASVERRATDWDDLGYPGAKFVQGVIIRANTFGNTKTAKVQSDRGVDQLTLSMMHDGEEAIAYPNDALGWGPFTTELVRLVGDDDVDWQLYDVRWVWEPAPELATEWHTQPTTHDLPGYLSVRDLVAAYQSTALITLRLIYYGGPTHEYELPTSGGSYRRQYLPLQTGKGRAVQYRFLSTAPFRLFKRDMSCRVQGWGLAGGYLTTMPFGGPSRADGAHI